MSYYKVFVYRYYKGEHKRLRITTPASVQWNSKRNIVALVTRCMANEEVEDVEIEEIYYNKEYKLVKKVYKIEDKLDLLKFAGTKNYDKLGC